MNISVKETFRMLRQSKNRQGALGLTIPQSMLLLADEINE
jgi:hypothetical protein